MDKFGHFLIHVFVSLKVLFVRTHHAISILTASGAIFTVVTRPQTVAS